MEIVLLVGFVSSIAAGLACAAEHGFAARHAWGAIERYGAGALTWLFAFAPPMIAAVGVKLLPIAVAVLLYAMAWLTIGGMAIGTWLCYQPPIALPDEDALAAKIHRALREE